MQPDDVKVLLESRRTIPLFLDDPVDTEIVLRALDAARWAPNHRLTEPWRFYLLGRITADRIVDLNASLTSKVRGEEAGNVKRRRWGAIPGWLVVTCDRSDDPVRAREDYAACACVVQNLMLYLWSAGIGTKWSTGEVTRTQEFHDLIGIPAHEEVVAMVWYGYPAHVPTCRRSPVADKLTVLP